MMPQIKHWLSPPVFPNDETKTRRAILLNTTLLTSLALALFLIAGNLAGSNVPLAVNGVDIIVFAVCLVARRWTYQGRTGLAGGTLLAVGLVGITVAITMMGTIRVPSAGIYMLLVITAGLLFDLGGMIIMTVLCALVIAGLIGAENAGLLAHPNYTNTITQWITYTVLFAWAGSLTLSSLQSTRQALMRANQEINARKQAEEALARALEEKNTLFRELQHRAKNSFVMIDSLIDLEAEQATEIGVQASLEKLHQRIYTLASLYTKLYAGGDAQTIRLDVYLAEVAQALVDAFVGSEKRLELRLDLDELTVNPKSASAFGLILNELMTNALKYAFPGDRRGFVSARLKRAGGGVVLEVADDGVGLPEGFDLTQSPGLGFKLVHMLAQQLGGEAYCEHTKTTRFGVRVNEERLG